MSAQVVVVGAGAMGVFIADALTRRKVRVAIVDEEPFAAFSSTRNQGWLQSGALYAARGDRDAAEACRAGSAAIREANPNAPLLDIPCYMMFETVDEQQYAIEQCADLGIPVLAADIDQLEKDYPLVRNSRLRFPVLTDDHPINTSHLLDRTLRRALESGADFVKASCSHVVTISDRGGSWRVSLGDSKSVSAATVVIATGPRLRTSAAQYFKKADSPLSDLTVTKIPVLAIQTPPGSHRLDTAMFVSPRAEQGPSIVPYRSSRGTGVTVCLNRADTPCDDRAELDDEIPASALSDFARFMRHYYPAWTDAGRAKHFADARLHVSKGQPKGNSAFRTSSIEGCIAGLCARGPRRGRKTPIRRLSRQVYRSTCHSRCAGRRD